jgi:hypothetical protein
MYSTKLRDAELVEPLLRELHNGIIAIKLY